MNRLDQIKALRLEQPDDPFLLFALAKEYEKYDQLEQALEHYEQLVNEHPDYVGVYYHLGKLREHLGQTEGALAAYNQGIGVATKVNDHHALGELATAKLQLED